MQHSHACRSTSLRFCRNDRIRGIVTDQLRNGFARLKDPGLLEACPGEIPYVFARQVGRSVPREQGGDQCEENHPLHRILTKPIRGLAEEDTGSSPDGAVSRRSTAGRSPCLRHQNVASGAGSQH